MQQFDYNKYLENNPLLKEERENYLVKGDNQILVRMEDSIDTIESALDQIINNPRQNIRDLAKYALDALEDIKSISKLKEAKNVKKDGDEIWFSDENYFKKEHEGYKLKPTDMVTVGDSKAMTYAQAKKKFAGETKKPMKEALGSAINLLNNIPREILKNFYSRVKQMESEGTDLDSCIDYAIYDMQNGEM
jgi:hypothetical protein